MSEAFSKLILGPWVSAQLWPSPCSPAGAGAPPRPLSDVRQRQRPRSSPGQHHQGWEGLPGRARPRTGASPSRTPCAPGEPQVAGTPRPAGSARLLAGGWGGGRAAAAGKSPPGGRRPQPSDAPCAPRAIADSSVPTGPGRGRHARPRPGSGRRGEAEGSGTACAPGSREGGKGKGLELPRRARRGPGRGLGPGPVTHRPPPLASGTCGRPAPGSAPRPPPAGPGSRRPSDRGSAEPPRRAGQTRPTATPPSPPSSPSSLPLAQLGAGGPGGVRRKRGLGPP